MVSPCHERLCFLLEIGYLLVTIVQLQVIDISLFPKCAITYTMYVYVCKYVGVMATNKLLSKIHEIISRFDQFKQDLNNF